MVAKQGRDIYHKKNTDVVVAENEDLVERLKILIIKNCIKRP